MGRLFRSQENRMIAGVASGLAKYFDVDVILVRLLWVLAAFAGGSGVLAYIVAWIIIPEEERVFSGRSGRGIEEDEQFITVDPAEEAVRSRRRRNAGLVLIGVGLFFLAHRFLPHLIFSYSWPILLIIIGLFLLLRDRKGDEW